MNLAAIDLNLLVAFEALMIERSVTRAGERIGLSQPAMSAALGRLRQLAGDELFVRASDGMRPTARAMELADPIRYALDGIRDAFDPQSFAPSLARQVFRIAMNDFGAAVLLPPLVERLGRLAPGIDLRILPASDERATDMLDHERVDLAVGSFDKPPSGRFDMTILFQATFVCALRQGHPAAAANRLTLEGFAALPHLLFSQTGDASGFVDAVLARHALSRRVAVTIPHFLVAPFILGSSEMVATLPSQLVERFGDMAGIRVIEAPVELPAFPCSLLWMRRTGMGPAHEWLREQVAEAARA